MKKLLYFLMATALICGCVKSEVEDVIIPEKLPTVEKEELTVNTLPESLMAYAANDGGDKTRTVVENKKVLWNKGDNIFYCTGLTIGAEYKYEGDDKVAEAIFDKISDGNIDSTRVAASFPVGVFPYKDNFGARFDNKEIEDRSDDVWTITPDFEQYQNYVPNSFDKDANIMIAVGNGKENNLSFRNACGYVVIRLYGTNVIVDRLRLFATPTGYGIPDQPRIWGKLYDIDVDANGNFTYRKLNPEGIWFQNMIELNCVDSQTNKGVRISEDKNNPTEFWFAVPPIYLKDGIRITVIDSNGHYVNKEGTQAFEIERNKVKRMAAVDATNTDRTNLLWYTTSEDEPLSKFESERESFKYFDAKIIRHEEGSNPETKKWMTCIEFDRPLTEIKKDAFKDVDLTNIILPDALKIIGESSFEGNEQLKSVTLQSNVTTIGKRAFYDNTELEVCNFSEELTIIGDEAFRNTGITSPKIPGKVTLIGQNAFNNCKKLTSVIFEPSITGAKLTIGKGAFQKSGLTYLDIPERVAVVEQNAFANCLSLASVVVEPSTTPLTIGSPSTAVSGDHPFYDSNNITTLILNRDLAKAHANVPMALFRNHSRLTNVQLSEQVKSIYDEMFYNTGIQTITIPGSVTLIEENAFSACENLTTVTFEPNSSNTPLTIDVQSKYLNYTPFYDSNNITTLNINRELVAANDYMPMALFENHSRLANINIGAQMKTIHKEMFVNCIGLTSVVIPGNVTTIGDYAFEWCSYLKDVTIEGGDERVRKIGNGAFRRCTNLTSFNFTGISNIGDDAFAYCKNLPSIKIPGSVDFIGNNTFRECTSLKSVNFASGEGSVTIGCMTQTYAVVGDTENGPFYHSPLTEITLNRTIYMSEEYEKAVDDYDEGIFSYKDYNKSSHSTTLTVGAQVRVILPYMFAGSGITSINIPANVTKVGHNAFIYCTKLSEVNIEESAKPLPFGYQYYNSADWGPFYDSPLKKVSLKRDIDLVNSNGQSFTADDWDEGAFATKHKILSSISIGTNVTKLSPYMFSKSTATAVWIPHTIKTIGDYAFYDSDNLSGVTLGFDGKLDFYRPSIGEEVFDSCSKFNYIKVRKSLHTRFQTSDKNDQWYPYQKWIKWADDFE